MRNQHNNRTTMLFEVNLPEYVIWDTVNLWDVIKLRDDIFFNIDTFDMNPHANDVNSTIITLSHHYHPTSNVGPETCRIEFENILRSYGLW